MHAAKVLVPLLFLLSACGTTVQVGQDFDLAAFEGKVQRGVTTQADVRNWLGAPTGVGVAVETSGERYDEWTYYYGQGQLPTMMEARVKILQIKFDQQGIVRAYHWSGERK
jgi:hypothetical protein